MITNLFFKWFARRLSQAQEELQENIKVNLNKVSLGQAIPSGRYDHDMDSNADLQFRMNKAENGYVMSVRQIDRRNDRSINNLYLIPDENDLGQSIAHIITIESLKLK